MRQSAGSIKEARNGAYIHALQYDPNWQDSIKRTSAATANNISNDGSGGHKRANADLLNEVYTYLLQVCLKLSPFHRDLLYTKRNLSEDTVEKNLYRSVPGHDACLVVCNSMQEKFGDKLHGIPGFYKNSDGRWRMPHVDGFFIPYRDVQGRIVGLQIRLDKPRGSTKYIWFSTPPDHFSCGTSSGSPIHFAKPDRGKQSSSAVLIEGALKADIVCERWNVAAIAIAGASGFNPEKILAEIQSGLPEVKKLDVAFDADWKDNKAVRSGLERLLKAIPGSGLETETLEWDIKTDGKGLDDVLNNLVEKKGNNND
jgi:hypothetical protein